MNDYQLNEMLQDLKYLSKLDKYLREKGITIQSATQQDFYSFITESHKGEIDYYTGKPITGISYTEDMTKINDLVVKYRKLKTIIELITENEVL